MIKISEDYIESFDSTKLYIKRNIIEKAIATIIIIHGFAEHLGRYDNTTDTLNKLGYNVYRFDNRGHGASGGERGDIENFNDFIEDTNIVVELVKKEIKEAPIFILGHSMGGFIAAGYGIVYGDKINGQILSGAATLVPNAASGFKTTLIKFLNKLSPNIRIKNNLSGDICSVKNVVEDYKTDKLNLKDASVRFHYQFVVEGMNWLNKNLHRYECPCLILHGKEDKIISYKASENFYKKTNSKIKEIIVYEELYHEILNEDKKNEILSNISKWVINQISENN